MTLLDDLVAAAIDDVPDPAPVPVRPDPGEPRTFATAREREAWGLEIDRLTGEVVAVVAAKHRDHALHAEARRCWPSIPAVPSWATAVDLDAEELDALG